MSFDIKQLAELSGERARLIRYVLDQKVVANLELTRDTKRNTRVMNHYSAFTVLVAVSLLHMSLSKETVAWMMQRMDGAAAARGKLSLYRLYEAKERWLRLGDMETIWIKGKWFRLEDGERYMRPPVAEIRIALHRIRHILSRRPADS